MWGILKDQFFLNLSKYVLMRKSEVFNTYNNLALPKILSALKEMIRIIRIISNVVEKCISDINSSSWNFLRISRDIPCIYTYQLIENWGYSVRQSIVSLGSSLRSFQFPVFLLPLPPFHSSCYRWLTIFRSAKILLSSRSAMRSRHRD